MTEYDLSDCGVAEPVEIEGALTKVRVIEGARVVFLFDEHHTTPPCIAENIQNAEELIAKADVNLLCVESHAAGGPADNLSVVSGATQFADHFIGQAGPRVEGVECRELFDLQNTDAAIVLWAGVTPRSHPYDRVRSHCFIASLFRCWRQYGMDGNVILNAGRNHIDDILDIIDWDEIDVLVEESVSYVRVRPPAFPP